MACGPIQPTHAVADGGLFSLLDPFGGDGNEEGERGEVPRPVRTGPASLQSRVGGRPVPAESRWSARSLSRVGR